MRFIIIIGNFMVVWMCGNRFVFFNVVEGMLFMVLVLCLIFVSI